MSADQGLAPVAGEVDGPRRVRRDPVRPTRRTLVRWALLGLLVLGVSGLVGYVASALQNPVYGAEVEILYRVSEGSSQRAERELATQEVILQGRSVLQPAAAGVGMSVEEVQEAVSVETVGQSDVLRLRVTNNDPELALALAERISDRYVSTSVEEASEAFGETTAFIEDQLSTLNAELASVEQQQDALAADRQNGEGPSAEEQRLQAEAADLLVRISSYQELLAGLATQGTADVGILTGAYLLDEPLSPRPLRSAAAGLVVGMLIVAGVGALLARRWGYA